MAKKLSAKTFSKLAKRLSKTKPASVAAKRLEPLMEVELMKHLAHGGKKAAESAIKQAKIGTKKWEKVQRKGAIARWRNTIGLGLQVIEIGILASKAIKGTTVRYRPAKAAAPRKRSRRRK